MKAEQDSYESPEYALVYNKRHNSKHEDKIRFFKPNILYNNKIYDIIIPYIVSRYGEVNYDCQLQQVMEITH